MSRIPVRRPSDLLFFVTIGAMTALTSALFWIPKCLTLQDYTQFLVFARAVRDVGNPSSPFHGTYEVAPWFTPTSLPTQLAAALSRVLPGGIESAGKLIFSLNVVLLVVASSLLLRELQRPRWCVALIFPLFYNGWIFGGFFTFATAISWIVLGILLAVRCFRRPSLARGAALAACLCVVILWHGIAYMALGLAIAILWVIARFRTWLDRLLAALPTLPSFVIVALWRHATFEHTASPKAADYLKFWDAVEQFAAFIAPPFEHSDLRIWVFVVLVLATQLAPSALEPLRASPTVVRSFRVHNPMLLVGAAYLAAYFELPLFMYHVEGLCNRFAFLSLLCLVFVWKLPAAASFRTVVVGATLALGLWTTRDLRDRLRALDAQTRGASWLIDHELNEYDTLYYWPPNRGTTPELVHALIELEQIATVRKGGLPNTSFAGYGYTYVRLVGDRNPMPGLSGYPSDTPAMRRFDFVLATDDDPRPSLPAFRFVARSGRWSLFGVCGSRRFPTCD